jgi:putative iron-regulated protein
MMKKSILAAAVVVAAAQMIACSGSGKTPADPTVTFDAATLESVQKLVSTNADIALAAYTDSVKTAEDLKIALKAFTDAPTESTLAAAKKSWLVAREPYGQTEVYRFRGTPIDSTSYTTPNEDGPEGAINAWPLGEALIDYTKAGDDFTADQLASVDGQATTIPDGNVAAPGTTAGTNIINSAFTIDAALLETSETSGRDVLAGYHAIEFLLWGQDLNADQSADTKVNLRETGNLDGDGLLPTGGHRPVTDYTTDTYAARRITYLTVAVDKLIADLKSVRDQWVVGHAFRTAFETVADEADAKKKITEILTGMGTLSEGELAGERMQIAFSGNSQEDEHSCFSDNTHRDIWLNAEGVQNSFYGDYAGYDSTLDGVDDVTTNAVSGYGLDDLLTDLKQAQLNEKVSAALTLTEASYKSIDNEARSNGKPFDVLIQPANRNADSPVYKTIVALNAQSKVIAQAATQLGLTGTVVDPDGSACDTTKPDVACPE